MFISNKEKNEINENLDNHKFQIANLVKHVGELQVDLAKTEVHAIDDIEDKLMQLQKMYWGADKKVKALEKQVNLFERHLNTLQLQNKVLTKQNEILTKQNENRLTLILDLNKRLEKLEAKKGGRPPKPTNRIVIPAEQVQALKDAGVWDDPSKRIQSIDQFIKDEAKRKAEEKKQKQRGYNLAYRARQRAIKAAQKELL